MTRAERWLLWTSTLAVAVSGCAKHTGILAPTIKDPVVFDDTFGANVDFQAFMGSKLDALAIDSTEAFSGAASIRLTVPPPGDPSGAYSGGAFTTSRANAPSPEASTGDGGTSLSASVQTRELPGHSARSGSTPRIV